MWCNFKDVLQGRNKPVPPGEAPRQGVRLDEVWGAVVRNGGEGQPDNARACRWPACKERACLSSLT